jgi:Fe-S cluster assembly protein SufD
MTTALELASERLAAPFSRHPPAIDPNRQGWLSAIRHAAIAEFRKRGLPTPRDEAWRYTNLTHLAEVPFVPAAPPRLEEVGREELRRFTLPSMSSFQVVFVDGVLAPGLSSRALPSGRVSVTSLGGAATDEGRRLSPALAQVAPYLDQSLVALNTALFGDGALIALDDDASLDVPIHLVFVDSGQTKAAVTYPRVLVMLGARSRLTLVESYIGLGRGDAFTNAVTEILLAGAAELDHTKVMRPGRDAYLVTSTSVRQEAASRYASHVLALGSRLARNEVSVRLDGAEARATLDGLALADGGELVDNQTSIEHAVPDGQSDQRYRAIAGGDGRSVFNGRVHVHPEAQRTAAFQSSKNLLLATAAQAHTKPQLEIFADDVRCAHGATVGQLDEDAIFYLKSRGLGDPEARTLLTLGFAGVWVEALPDRILRDELRRVVAARLGGRGEA